MVNQYSVLIISLKLTTSERICETANTRIPGWMRYQLNDRPDMTSAVYRGDDRLPQNVNDSRTVNEFKTRLDKEWRHIRFNVDEVY